MSGRGRLIAVEGIDGCGKSTQARRLADVLGARRTSEPGSTPLGAELRRLVLGADLPPITARAEALLMAADRAQHVEDELRPWLEAGQWVVTERFSGSTLAYQGYGRGLDLPGLERLVTWAAGGLEPDLTVLLDVPVELAASRRAGQRPDRLEAQGADFHARVRAGYLALAGAAPGRWAVVEGAGEVEAVAEAVLAVVAARLGPLPVRAP
ncbi:MAG TPA: dTMP kinase [Acidimicrobiales bacterium]|nr:dTMP kinase [Acidimicrobiales bacterium]